MAFFRRIQIFFLIFLAACVSAQASSTSPEPAQSGPEPPQSTQVKSTPNSTATFTSSLPSPTVKSTPALFTPTPGALQLFFPTIIPVEGAEFRPPLYPTPWAISPHDHFYFAAPIGATYPGAPEWDYRYGGIFFGPDIIHSGIDLPAPRGTDILAAGPGVVEWAGFGLFSGSKYEVEDPYGLAVAIRHDFGYDNETLYTVYAHMEEVDVIVGQWVNTGDVIGNVGSTGLTTGPHLHFEVRLGENDFFRTRNPELWLSPPIGDGVLVGRVTSTYGTLLDSYLVSLKLVNSKTTYAAYTYGPGVVNSDSFYNENIVISNVPAGVYELNIPYGALNRIVQIQILPGQVTYFWFHGYTGFDINSIVPSPTPTRSP
jgi:murein DD-endopeptidase MepM/ murein hydrolase activator NlpD